MKKGLLIGLSALGLLAFFASSSKASAAPLPPVPPPTPPTPPPPAKPSAPSPATPTPKKPRPTEVEFGPITFEETPIPSGWIPTKPTPQIEQIRTDIQQKLSGSPAGTSFPFQVENKNYLAIVVMDSSGQKRIAILQPENQL